MTPIEPILSQIKVIRSGVGLIPATESDQKQAEKKRVNDGKKSTPLGEFPVFSPLWA